MSWLYDAIVKHAASLDVAGSPASAVHPDDARQTLAQIGERRAAGERVRAEAMRDLERWAPAAVEAGVTRVEIARLAGVSRTTVYAILDGPDSRGRR